MGTQRRQRLDMILVEQGFCESRARAQGIILAGGVLVNGQKEDKPGTRFDPESVTIRLLQEDFPFVSRGGLKLQKALSAFEVDVTGAVCLDIGASTGGFTDCLLRAGAQRVYSVDVGYGQLDWRLRQDERVVVLERTNIRDVTTEQVPEPLDIVVSDVSFISLKKAIPPVLPLIKPGGTMILLLKPQFEYLDYLPELKKSFDGVVRDCSDLKVIIEGLLCDLELSLPEWLIHRFCVSPIQGPKGNWEFLLQVSAAGCFDSGCSGISPHLRLRETIEDALNYIQSQRK